MQPQFWRETLRTVLLVLALGIILGLLAWQGFLWVTDHLPGHLAPAQ